MRMPPNGNDGRRPTIRDVAERAGVSKSLVSLVMRGNSSVREDKRRRVEHAAEELGYRPNLAARSLSTVRSKTIGILMADLRNPFQVDVVEQAEQVLEEAGYHTLLTSAVRHSVGPTGPRIDGGAIGALKDLSVEAFLFVGSVPDREGIARIVRDIPVVVAGAKADGLRADVVRNDDHLGMRLIVDHLVTVGHRHIAHLGGLGGGVAEDRVAGYRAAMRHHSLDDDVILAEANFTEDSGYRGAAQLLRGPHPITAVAAINDLAAIGAMSAAIDAGLKLPDELAVTGYDDSFVAAIRQVSLTSVNWDSIGIGTIGARCVLERIGDPNRPFEEHLVSPRLVVRTSSSRKPPVSRRNRPGPR
jgi:DNA-binding LacI/PurR family transcriptional regulator